MLKNIKVLWTIIVIQVLVICYISGVVEIKLNLPFDKQINQVVE